jgi:hypothetical protein
VQNFLIVTAATGEGEAANRVFEAGLQHTRRWNGSSPDSFLNSDWVKVAQFPRQQGRRGTIACDASTSSWLFAIGTWFHSEDYASGEELLLLKRYLDIGSDQLAQELEGFFVIAIGDGRTKETVVITDLVGSCHGFVRSWKYGFILSGSSFILATLGNTDLDPVGCQEFLLTGTIYEDRTFYEQVRKLGPAAVYRFGEHGKKSQRYWKIQEVATESLDRGAAVDQLAENLTRAAKKIGKTFSHPVCDLTGGYDSRATLAAFLNAGVQVSTTVSGPESHPDVAVSRGLAAMLGITHLNLNPPEPQSFGEAKTAFPFTDGEYDLFEYASVLEVHRELSKRFDVSINGSYGEVARGYWWELLFPYTGARRPLDCGKVARKRYAAGIANNAFIHPQLRLDMVSHLTGVLERTNAGLSGLSNTVQLDHLYLSVRMQRWQGKIASSTNRLWPCISPFLFRSVLESMLCAKTSVRRFSLLIREMLAKYQPCLAEFPLEHGYPALPVDWKNFYRFWPVPVYYGQRVVSKMLRLACGSWGSSVSQSGHRPVGLQLWHDEEVCELLQPTTMKLGCLLHQTALVDFLKRGQREIFPFNDQWARMLSVEYTLHRLEQMKSAHPHFSEGSSPPVKLFAVAGDLRKTIESS